MIEARWRVVELNPAFRDIPWNEWEPTDEERIAALVEAEMFLTSPPVQEQWDYVTLQVSGGDVTGVYRPPSYEIVPGHRS